MSPCEPVVGCPKCRIGTAERSEKLLVQKLRAGLTGDTGDHFAQYSEAHALILHASPRGKNERPLGGRRDKLLEPGPGLTQFEIVGRHVWQPRRMSHQMPQCDRVLPLSTKPGEKALDTVIECQQASLDQLQQPQRYDWLGDGGNEKDRITLEWKIAGPRSLPTPDPSLRNHSPSADTHGRCRNLACLTPLQQ